MAASLSVTIRDSWSLGRVIAIEGLSGGRCSYHCVYCGEVETAPTTKRRLVTPVAGALRVVEEAVESAGSVDHLVVGGPGDPLLWTGFHSFLRRLRFRFNAPIAVLTPGPLVSRSSIRAGLDSTSVVVVKLDGGSTGTLRAVARPHRGVRLSRLLESLAGFARTFKGELWVQTETVPGLNDGPGDRVKLSRALALIAPGRLIHGGPPAKEHDAPVGIPAGVPDGVLAEETPAAAALPHDGGSEGSDPCGHSVIRPCWLV